MDLEHRMQVVHQRLLGYYGYPTWRTPLPPLDELISTILSQNTNDINRDRAFAALKEKFSTWENVRDAEPSIVVDAIRQAGLANQKGPRIQKVLKDITQMRGELNLAFLADLPDEDAREWLLQFKGVGPKTAAIVLQFSLGKLAFPVDTHIYRVTGRLGIRPSAMSADKSHEFLEKLLDPRAYYAAHLNLIRLGREICQARQPDCAHCPLNDLCDYYTERFIGKNITPIS
jgi:endonuclease III